MFLVECVTEAADELAPIAAVMWNGRGTEVIVTEFGADSSAPKAMADALRKLVS